MLDFGLTLGLGLGSRFSARVRAKVRCQNAELVMPNSRALH